MSSQVSGNLITRNYMNFRGVDFSNKEVNLRRSPDSLNMWKNYKSSLGKCIETRPDIELFKSFNNTVYGLFFYKVGSIEHMIVHCGTQLLDIVNGKTTVLKANGMNPRRSYSFIYNNIFYLKDGINYLEYDGQTCQEVVGYIPTTSISRKPSGGGVTYEDVNLLTGIRKNSFTADGSSKVYVLDATNIDSNFSVIVRVNNVTKTIGTDYSVDTTRGEITFVTAPEKPLTDGQDNVFITYRKTIPGHRERINKCTLLCVFDNRIFFSGNQDYPNAIFHSSLDDPRYCSDLDYYPEGRDSAEVKSMVAGNNALWVFKEPSQANTTVFYHNPIIDADYGKIYPSVHSSISTGCIGTGINFNDDIVFFSERGMEAISGDVTTEQVLAHRSSLVDNKLLNEINYKDMILEEYEGYLFVIIDNHIYLADSNEDYTNGPRYEWYYWELSKNITSTCVKDGVLYLCSEDGIYTLTSDTTADYENKFNKSEMDYNFNNGCAITELETGVRLTANVNGMYLYQGFKIGGSELLGQILTLNIDMEASADNVGKATIYFVGGTTLISSLTELTTSGETIFTMPTSFPEGADSVYVLLYANVEGTANSGDYIDYTNVQVGKKINSHWTTPEDEFTYPQYLKTTNKKGCVIDMDGKEITVSTKTDNNDIEKIDTYTNVKGYVVCRIKKKKWKSIQLKFSSDKPFSIYQGTIQAFVGSYVKR